MFDIAEDKIKLLQMPTAKSEVARGLKYIVEEQTKNAVSKFIFLSELINVDCFEDYALKLCVVVCSRYKMEQKGALIQLCFSMNIKEIELIDNTAIDSVASNETFVATNFDWTFLLNKLEFDPKKETTRLASDPVIIALKSTVESTMLPNCDMPLIYFTCRILLFSSIANTPASRMVENFINDLCKKNEVPTPHDLEVRVMRTLASIHDTQKSSKRIIESILLVLEHMCVVDSLNEMVRFLISERAMQSQDEIQVRKQQGRPSLQQKAKSITLQEKNDVKYDMSFAEWQASQRFSTNMSHRMQRFLYFIRVQVGPLELPIYLQFFDESVARRARDSVVGHIESKTIIEVLQLVRCYSHNINALIDFRTTVLLGLSQTVRQKLNMAQVVQLYISCYQHASIREECFRSFTNSFNYAIKNNCEIFREKHPFDIDAVLKTLQKSIFE